VIFIHLRDRAHADEAAHRGAGQVRPEYAIAVEGAVALRSADTVNSKLEAGEVELSAEKIWILNESRAGHFPMDETVGVAEEVRQNAAASICANRTCSATSSCAGRFCLPCANASVGWASSK